MSRILFFVFLAFVAWLVVRLLAGARKRGDASPATVQKPVIETVSQCAWCGVHVPRNDASTLPDGRIYCGVAHRDAALQAAAATDRARP